MLRRLAVLFDLLAEMANDEERHQLYIGLHHHDALGPLHPRVRLCTIGPL